MKHLILNEVNVKELEYLKDTTGILVKKIRPNFKVLGPRYGRLMKDITRALEGFSQEDISCFESQDWWELKVGGEVLVLSTGDVEITSEDIPGWLVASEGKLTVALDVNITQELKDEGIAREFVNRIQNIRKDSGFEVTDKIAVDIQQHDLINNAVNRYRDYIASQTLARTVNLVDQVDNADASAVELEENIITYVRVSKI
jgi:isoleucyl-tRNA synthetase